jgi:hypothetical protein
VRIEGTTSTVTDWGDADFDELNDIRDGVNLNFGWPCTSGQVDRADPRCVEILANVSIEYPQIVADLANGEGRLSNFVLMDAPRQGLGGVYFQAQTESGVITAYRYRPRIPPFGWILRLSETLADDRPDITSIDMVSSEEPHFVDHVAGSIHVLRTDVFCVE